MLIEKVTGPEDDDIHPRGFLKIPTMSSCEGIQHCFRNVAQHNWLVVSNIFLMSPLLGEIIQFDSYFSNGLKPPTR